MKQEYVNAFIKGSMNVLETTTQTSFKTGAPSLRTSTFMSNEVVVSLGIIGELKGQVVISMQRDCAKKLASKMMMGMPVDELNEMSRSALCELGNMIMGNVATALFNTGTQIDITPPTLLIGSNIEIFAAKMITINIPLLSDEIHIDLDISVQEN